MKLSRRRSNAKTAAASKKYLERGTQWLLCSRCQAEEIEVGPDVSSVICSLCVQHLVPAPAEKVTKHLDGNGEKFPRGWHLKKRYVASDGTVYERGKKIGEGGIAPVKQAVKRERIVKKPTAKRGRPPKSSGGTTRKRGRPRKNGKK